MMPLRVDALKKAGVVKPRKKKIYKPEVRVCENGTIRQLRKLYDTIALSLKDCETLVKYHSTHGCSQCEQQEQLGTCHCNKTCCTICIGMCVVCKRFMHIRCLSKTDAISVITSALREFLLQVCALQPALESNANEILKKNFIVAMLNTRLCFTELDVHRVDITP